MIRPATLADVPAIEAALLRMKRRTEFCTVKVEFERARHAIRQCISSAQGFAMVAEHEGRITGVLIGLATHFWYSRERYASDLAFYSQRAGDGHRLMKAFLEWAARKGAVPLMGQSSGQHQRAAQRFYESFGLTPIGTLYAGDKPIVVADQLREAS